MKTPGPIPLARAQKIAEKIAEAITPFCAKIEIAGSIRRRRPFCGDIDLVVLPKPGQLSALQARFKEKSFALREGPQNAMYQLQNGVQLDVFFAWEKTDLFTGPSTNWGSLLICRTGSAAHNMYLIQHSKTLDLIWHPYNGVVEITEGRIIASATEADIFKALKLEFIPPESRER
jgi:DNA polymerase/3'-5' exonuclease PolX